MSSLKRAIPQQLKGFKKHFEASRKFVSAEDAHLCYDHAITRLLNINNWHELTMLEKGDVQLISRNLKPQRRKAKLDDYVRFGIPAPNNADGDGGDWVQVKNILFSSGKRKEQCLLTLQPCAMPGGDATVHFFASASSSTFLITRDGRIVTAEYYGRNELPNINAGDLKTNVRNVAVAAGAIIGFSDTMWEPMMPALIMDGAKLRDQQQS